MKVTANLSFEELLRVVKSLPEEQLSRLKKELGERPRKQLNKEEMLDFLLNGPIFSEEQIKEIENARKNINRWRDKPL